MNMFEYQMTRNLSRQNDDSLYITLQLVVEIAGKKKKELCILNKEFRSFCTIQLASSSLFASNNNNKKPRSRISQPNQKK